VRKAREASGEDLLSGAPEGTRVHYRTPPLQRPANSPSDFATSFFFFHFFHLSLLVSFFRLHFFLEAREARTTCLLEKSARLPRALINLHSARGVRKEEGGGDSSWVTTCVTRINVVECGMLSVKPVNSSNACANGFFNRREGANESRWRR